MILYSLGLTSFIQPKMLSIEFGYRVKVQYVLCSSIYQPIAKRGLGTILFTITEPADEDRTFSLLFFRGGLICEDKSMRCFGTQQERSSPSAVRLTSHEDDLLTPDLLRRHNHQSDWISLFY